MLKSKISELINLFAMPVLLIVLGVILLVNPDSATILVTKTVGWILVAVGACYGLYALGTWPVGRIGKLATALICIAAGGFLLLNPLFLAKNISRFLGVLLAVEGVENLLKSSGSKGMAVITILIAAVLIMMPLAASRLVFLLCSIVLLAVGIAQLADRLRGRRKLPAGEDPNIIDAL